MEKQTTTFKLDKNIDKDALYFIDWSKLKDMNDLVLIIASLGISMSPMHPAWPQIEHLMDLNRPINTNKMPYEQEFHPVEKADLKLPKLKMVKK